MLSRRGEKSDITRLARHYRQSDNMTDQTAALALLADHSGPEREKVLADFYKRWKDDHVVIDRWFAVQAASSLPDTPERVALLKQHELFSMTNPNKVRALVGSFAGVNMLAFNRPDGAGYKLVADTVLELDSFNPSVAARLLGAFRSWRTLEPKRRRLAKRSLDRIARKKELSRDVFEIVSKTLE
jgi:aminopeptidase N